MGQVKVLNHRDSRVVLAKLGGSLPDGRAQVDELVLEGGANNVDEARLAEFKALPNNKLMFDSGLLVVEGPVTEGKEEKLPQYGGDLSKLKLVAALKAIKSVKDPRVLRQMINQDGRPEIRKALIERHAELNKGDVDNEKPGSSDKED